MDQNRFQQTFAAFSEHCVEDGRFKPTREDFRPVLDEDTPGQGYDSHYVLHTGWAARILAQTRPTKHVDISSSVFFVSIASAIVPFEFYDYRETRIPLPGIDCKGGADLTDLPFEDNSIESLSCLHVIEHIGLGRYGDRVDAGGDRKAARELARVLKPGGQLLVAMPVGQPRVMFNAHRIYSYRHVRDLFPELHLREFSLIPEWKDGKSEFIYDASPSLVANETHVCGACGCFWYVKERR